MPAIKEVLVERNTWWKGTFKADYKDREIYGRIRKFIKMPQIIAFTGLRRVGKSTLMHKIIEDKIAEGFDPKNIIYFPFDEFKDAEIRNIIAEYERIVEKDIQKEKFVILLDEVQKLRNWEDQLKSLYDVHKGRIKFFISGSESLFIGKKVTETLGGRIFSFKVEPLKFREFLAFRNFTAEPAGIYGKELLKIFDEFVLTMGFPELVGVKDREVVKKYVKEGIVDKVIYRDLPALFPIKDLSLMESLLNILIEGQGQIVEVGELSKELRISRQTVSLYLRYLQDAFLVRKLYNFSTNRRKIERKLKKYYTAVNSADSVFSPDQLSKSKVFEWLVVNQLEAEFFWRDTFKNEVDVVMANDKFVPVEIKYGKTRTDGLLAFMKRFGIGEGYIVSYDKEEDIKTDGKVIHVVPAFKFLLTEKTIGND